MANVGGLVDLLRTEISDLSCFAQTNAYLQQNLQHLNQVLRDINTTRHKQTLAAHDSVQVAEVTQRTPAGVQALPS